LRKVGKREKYMTLQEESLEGLARFSAALEKFVGASWGVLEIA
jgi:hypothetical protein